MLSLGDHGGHGPAAVVQAESVHVVQTAAEPEVVRAVEQAAAGEEKEVAAHLVLEGEGAAEGAKHCNYIITKMIYKITPMGYFGRVSQTSRGPWFSELRVEDDNLEWYYTFQDAQGMRFLLSNNMTVDDREDFARLWKAHNRASGLAMFAGFYAGLEVVTRHSYFKKMAAGWRVASFFGVAYGFKCLFNAWNAQTYGPIMGAYLRKYNDASAADLYEISDRKREYYEIDTSQYMNDMCEDVHSHVNHGPQPDGEQMDSSWLSELDAFLANKPNNLKKHHKYMDYNFEFKDKSFPSVEQAADLIAKH